VSPPQLGGGSEQLFSVARATKGFMPEPEGLALYRAGRAAAVAVAAPGPLLEIGTYCAKSAIYLGAAARDAGRVLFSVDHHRGSEENQPGWEHHDPTVVDGASGRMDTLPWARRAIEEASLEDTVVLVVGPSEVVASCWTTALALLFVDGGHGAEVEWADYRLWTPRISVGGLLAIHDVFPDPADGGRPPYEIYCEARASPEFEDCPELGCGSLRVLRRIGLPLLLPATPA
jgi:MMP 1-O-methyltransferase